MSTINDLLSVAEQIGGITDSNGHFTEGLARRIDETGKKLADLTLSELIPLIDQYREFYNRSLSGSMGNEPLVNANSTKSISIDDMLARQDRERGFELLPLESELLLKRVKDGGHSGQFLADAFISSYRTSTTFDHSLGEIMKLDTEAIRLFHEVLHLRFIKGWSDDTYYDIEQEIKAIVAGGVQ